MKKTKEKGGFEGVVKAAKSPVIHNLTPAVSSPEGRAAKLGLLEVEKYGNPTTVETICGRG